MDNPLHAQARPQGEPSVARQVLLLQVLVVLMLVVASIGLAAYDARRDARATATDRAWPSPRGRRRPHRSSRLPADRTRPRCSSRTPSGSAWTRTSTSWS